MFGREPEYVISPGTYDQKHIARIGHLHDCIAYGPGILDLAHRPDEWVGIDDMVESAKVMAIGLDRLLRGKRQIALIAGTRCGNRSNRLRLENISARFSYSRQTRFTDPLKFALLSAPTYLTGEPP